MPGAPAEFWVEVYRCVGVPHKPLPGTIMVIVGVAYVVYQRDFAAVGVAAAAAADVMRVVLQ